MAFAKLFVFGFLALSVIFLSLSVYFRSIRRENLENEWAEENPDGGDAAARDTYIDKGMAEYEASTRKKLLLLIYIIPALAVTIIMYLTN